MTTTFKIGVVGNPNCGKTTLFNALTGSKQRVGNWPGVTVERKVGVYQYASDTYEIIDLPGTYSLDVTSDELSLDEKIARDFIHTGEVDLIVNILDASNLERNLYLTMQLIEMRRPMIVALNMLDVAAQLGMRMDTASLAECLGCPVVSLVAVEKRGINQLREQIATSVKALPIPSAQLAYEASLETVLAELMPQLASVAFATHADQRWLAARLLEGDDLARRLVSADIVSESQIQAWRKRLSDDIDILLADGRYGMANAMAQKVVRRKQEVSRHLSNRIDTIVLNRVLGIPLFLLMMYLMFMFTINIGGSFIDFFDIVVGTLVVDGLAEGLGRIGAPQGLTILLAQGLGGGIQVVATFIPVIACLYLFLSVLEDSGYMARAAFVMDRAMRVIGLPGKSFVPLLVGFGCNVPAIMATRTLEHYRDRILTIVMTPFMSCGARLPVYALFAVVFFPSGGQNVVFSLYLIGIGIAVLTGLVLKNTLLQGKPSPFVMELPPYHLPTVSGVLGRTWERTQSFVVRAGRVIVPMVLVLNVLNSLGTDGRFSHDNSEHSVLSELGRSIAPAFAPMGLDEENWPAVVGIFTGVMAKEAVLGTLDTMYSALGAVDASASADHFDFWAGMAKAVATIPENLANALGTWRDPLGIDIGEWHESEAVATMQEIQTGTLGAMAARFDGAAGAFAYLLFILLYMPCAAALAAVYRETNSAWTAFVAVWTTGTAYITATIYYQTAIFTRQPSIAMEWITVMISIFVVAVVALRWWGQRGRRRAFEAGAVDAT